MKINKIPWSEMMHYASYALNITPKDFWELTMPEFFILIKPRENKGKHITRDQLKDLIRKFE